VAARLKRILTVAANTFRETVRERVLYNLIFFALLMTGSGLFLGQLSIGQDEKIVKDIGLAAMDVFGTLIAVFIGVGLVSKEIERRSLHPLLAKPLTRGEFFLGKFAGLSFTLFVNIAVMATGLFLTLWVTGHRAGAHLLKAVYPLYLGLLLVVSLSLLFSTLTSSALASVCSVSVVVAGRFSDVIRNMREVAPGVPSWLVTLLYYVIPPLRNFDLKDRVAYGDPVPLAALGWITLDAVLYIALFLYVGLAVFERRDFN
jgi:ABC-type transport system involved in multi-copper enzyme maturation permease subunit